MRIDDDVSGYSLNDLNIANVTLEFVGNAPPKELQSAHLDNSGIEFVGENWRVISVAHTFTAPKRNLVHLTLSLVEPWIQEIFVENEGRRDQRRISKFRRGGKVCDRPDWPPPGSLTKGL